MPLSISPTPSPIELKEETQLLMDNYGFVSERYIDGERYVVWRSISDPKDEILANGKEAKPFKIKGNLDKMQAVWSDKKIKASKIIDLKIK